MMVELKEIWRRLERFKYPLLILVLGIILMLLPGEKKTAREIPAEDERLEQILTSTRGVGEARVLISDSGVVIVCRGAASSSVRLDIIRAVRSYTGFGSDKITILQLAD